MLIEISDKIIQKANLDASQIVLRVAIELFKEEALTLAQASEFANLHQIQFQKELAKRKIPIHYDVDEFRADLEILKKIKQK